MRKNDAFVTKIVNSRLTKGSMAIFAPAESLPSPATLRGDEAFVRKQGEGGIGLEGIGGDFWKFVHMFVANLGQ